MQKYKKYKNRTIRKYESDKYIAFYLQAKLRKKYYSGNRRGKYLRRYITIGIIDKHTLTYNMPVNHPGWNRRVHKHFVNTREEFEDFMKTELEQCKLNQAIQ